MEPDKHQDLSESAELPVPQPQADLAAAAKVAQASANGGTPGGANGSHPDEVALPPRSAGGPLKARRGHVAPAMIPIERIDEDPTFRLRPEGDISHLATDIARLGQLFPIEVRLRRPDRFQVVCGFRRLAALRFLQREKVVARLHTDLSDEDALLMALADAVHGQPVTPPQLELLKQRLEQDGRLTPEARDLLDKALSPADNLAPEGVEEEVDADELARNVTVRLGEINQDLALLADVFASLDPEQRKTLLEQLRYSAELVAYLEGL